MRTKLILLAGAALLATAYRARGQSSASLTDFREQQRITKTGMLTLGSWAVGNFVVSGLSLNEPKDDRYYFHQMNVLWNTVNVTLAGLGYWRATRLDTNVSLAKAVKSHHGLRRTLLFNAGLDVAYGVGGLYLLERAKNDKEQAARWRGYGRSLILQGSFLLAFDAVLYLVLAKQADSLEALIGKLSVRPNGVGFIHRF
ncbi:MAG: hypothetical protein WA960_04535 [Tunicatimonas sp.]